MFVYLAFSLVITHSLTAEADQNKDELVKLVGELNPLSTRNRLIDNKEELDQFCKNLDEKFNRAVKLINEVYSKVPKAIEMLTPSLNYEPMKDYCKDDQTKSRYLKAANSFNTQSLSEFQRVWKWYLGSVNEIVRRNQLTQLSGCFYRDYYRDTVKLLPNDDETKRVLMPLFESMINNPVSVKLGGGDLEKRCAGQQLPEPSDKSDTNITSNRNFAVAAVDLAMNV